METETKIRTGQVAYAIGLFQTLLRREKRLEEIKEELRLFIRTLTDEEFGAYWTQTKDVEI